MEMVHRHHIGLTIREILLPVIVTCTQNMKDRPEEGLSRWGNPKRIGMRYWSFSDIMPVFSGRLVRQ